MACGLTHLLVLTKETGKLFAIGDGSSGNLGQGNTYSSDKLVPVNLLQTHFIVKIEAGRHSAALSV